MPSGANTIFFIPKGKDTVGRKVTYGKFMAQKLPQKAETHGTKLIVGGNLIHFPGDVTTSIADLKASKLVLNSVVSTKM